MTISLNFDVLLAETIAGIGAEFRADELAYLATTTKAELPFRDRLAFRLHQRCIEHDMLVARELGRVDIGIIDNTNSPRCLIELKAMYTFDALRAPQKFVDATSADEQKARRLVGATTDTAVYSLLLATHLNTAVEPRFTSLVKYAAGINGALSKSDAAMVLTNATTAVNELLSHRNVVAAGTIQAGNAFGMEVSLLFWLVRDRFDS